MATGGRSQGKGITGTGDGAERRRLQMADVARLAGVSVATVSRALNGSTLVSKETRERIEQLARQLNYTINIGAKNLRLQENRTIAVVVPFDRTSRQHISDPFFLAIVGSLADALTERGFDMLLSRVDADDLEAASRPVDSGAAIGVVLIGQWRHHDQLNRMASRGVPLVVWGAQLPQQLYCTVGGDNVLGGRLAAEHLLAHGKKRLLFLGDPELPEVAHRLQGCQLALGAVGQGPQSLQVWPVPFEENEARKMLAEKLARQESTAFDGIVACSDLLAITAIRRLRELGRSVPDDVSVVGYDNVAFAAYCEPPLSTIDQPLMLAGQTLVGALVDQVEGGRPSSRLVPVKLVVRGSSIPAR